MAPRRRSELYRLAVGLAALAVFAAGLGHLRLGALDQGTAATLVVSGVLAMQFPININLSQKLSVASAVFFASSLLLPARDAAALVAGVACSTPRSRSQERPW